MPFLLAEILNFQGSTHHIGVGSFSDLFVTAGEVAQDLGISKPFAYKLVRQMNEELETKGFITIAGRVSRKYYEEKFYGMAQAN